jgi:hypothetical protein
VTRATKETTSGKRYLDLQREARQTGRPTDELIQLYALECFLDRLVHSDFADNFVLKGGVLLAALDARRPTRDIDLSARALDNDAAATLEVIRKISAITLDDGLVFDSAGATAEAIREDDNYSGVRVTLGGTLSRAIIRLHVDVNVGDPIWPEPMSVRLPRLLDGWVWPAPLASFASTSCETSRNGCLSVTTTCVMDAHRGGMHGLGAEHQWRIRHVVA